MLLEDRWATVRDYRIVQENRRKPHEHTTKTR
jgi:hypothetical protein